MFKVMTWPNTITSYSDLINVHHRKFKPMLELVKQISSTRYASGIYPAISMTTLIISQAPSWEFKHEVLEIEYHPNEKQFVFTFWENPNTKPWVTHSTDKNAFQRFEHCMLTKKWFA
jgi:hypothetical protein